MQCSSGGTLDINARVMTKTHSHKNSLPLTHTRGCIRILARLSFRLVFELLTDSIVANQIDEPIVVGD